jgi:hypothetical protein
LLIGPLQRHTGDPEMATESAEDGTEQSARNTDSAGPTVSHALLEHAKEQWESGQPDATVRASYTAVRKNLEGRIGASDGLTHWEFYQKCSDAGGANESVLGGLRAATEAYEQATFSDEGVSSETAQRVFEYAMKLCLADSSQQSERISSADD